MEFMKRFIHDKNDTLNSKPRRRKSKSIHKTPKKQGKRVSTPQHSDASKSSKSSRTAKHKKNNKSSQNNNNSVNKNDSSPIKKKKSHRATPYKFRNSAMLKNSEVILEDDQMEGDIEFKEMNEKFKILSQWNEEIKNSSLENSIDFDDPSTPRSLHLTQSLESDNFEEISTKSEDQVLGSQDYQVSNHQKSPLTVNVSNEQPQQDSDDEDLFKDIDLDNLDEFDEEEKSIEDQQEDENQNSEKKEMTIEKPQSVHTPVREKTTTPMNFYDQSSVFQQKLREPMTSTTGTLNTSTQSMRQRPRSSIPKLREISRTPAPHFRRQSATQRDPVHIHQNPSVGLVSRRKTPKVYIRHACPKRVPHGTKPHVYEACGFCLYCHHERKLAKNQNISKRLYSAPQPKPTQTQVEPKPIKKKKRKKKKVHHSPHITTKKRLPNGMIGELDISEIQRLHKMTTKALQTYKKQKVTKKVKKMPTKKVKTPTKAERQQYLSKSRVVPRQDRKQAIAYYKRIPFDKMVLEEYKNLGKLLSTKSYYIDRLSLEREPIEGLKECLDDLELIFSQKTYKRVLKSHRSKIHAIYTDLKELYEDYTTTEEEDLDLNDLTFDDDDVEPSDHASDDEGNGSGGASDEILDEEESLINQYLQDNPNVNSTLKVTIHRLLDLPKADLFSSNDIYCVLRFNASPVQKVKTRVFKGSNPEIDTTFQFNCQDASSVDIDVFDKDILKDDLLAILRMDASSIKDVKEKEYSLLHPKTNAVLPKAKIVLSIHSPPHDVASPNTPPPVEEKERSPPKKEKPPLLDVLPTLPSFQ
mmetsp:Transcript_6825/g.9961  ORF Transcript_6825/g.9961 Transcript_6825/m.9961 type:complete len:807 (+) Transcript_6825:42-2462(+)